MPTHVSYERAVNKMRALGNVLHRPLKDVLDSGARVCAISLAKSTQPSRGGGTGNESKEIGEKAVARDIARVYATPSKAWRSISLAFARAIFWKAFKNDEIAVAQQILWDWSRTFNGVLMERFDGGRKHHAARSTSTGRVLSTGGRAAVIVTDPEKLASYIEKVKRKVGFAKGGWADVAKQISGNASRGLKQEGDISASWISRHAKAGFGKVHRSGTDDNPIIRITNSVPYLRRVLSSSAETYAKNVAHDRMIENLRKAVAYETKKLRSAA